MKSSPGRFCSIAGSVLSAWNNSRLPKLAEKRNWIGLRKLFKTRRKVGSFISGAHLKREKRTPATENIHKSITALLTHMQSKEKSDHIISSLIWIIL